jgi:hypothetical protein
MSMIVALSRTALLALMLGGLPVLGRADTQPSAREDNIWGGKAHQPTQSEVVQQERLDGLALTPQRDRLENDEVESLYQSLLQVPVSKSSITSGTAAIPATPASPVGVRPYIIPTPAPSSPISPQQTQPAPPGLPNRGAPVFGSGGIAGTVTSNGGSFAVVAPQGGGPLGILTPQSNSTGLLSVPGGPSTIVLTRP